MALMSTFREIWQKLSPYILSNLKLTTGRVMVRMWAWIVGRECCLSDLLNHVICAMKYDLHDCIVVENVFALGGLDHIPRGGFDF
jgi:hypothetical protein